MTARRKLLFISPHFPPDSSAGAHRARLLAPWLAAAGWEPTILTVDARDYETRLDPALARAVPDNVRVERVRAWPVRSARRIGFGDLGLRALYALRRKAFALLDAERYDALYITIYPSYPAVIGRWAHERSGVPFILDYQDPWVGAWGLDVGGGTDGRPDMKSRVTRRIASRLEPWTLAAASGITAVSETTYRQIAERVPYARTLPFLALPIGADNSDLDVATPASQQRIQIDAGLLNLCYVGTVLPLGMGALRAVLEGIALLRREQPALGARIRAHFFGTSNQSSADRERVLPLAREIGVADAVTEVPGRLDYFEALAVQRASSILLLLGSTEPHYTPSKLYPALMTGNALLGMYHSASSARDILEAAAGERAVEFIPLSESAPAAELARAAAGAIARLAERRPAPPGLPASATAFAAESLARSLGAFLDRIVETR